MFFREGYADKVKRNRKIEQIKKKRAKGLKISRARKGKTYKKRKRGRPVDKTIPNIVGQRAKLKGGNVYVVSAKRGKYKKKTAAVNLNSAGSFGASGSSTWTPKVPTGGWTGWNKTQLDLYKRSMTERDRRPDSMTTTEAIKMGRNLEREKLANEEKQEQIDLLEERLGRAERTIQGVQAVNNRDFMRSKNYSPELELRRQYSGESFSRDPSVARSVMSVVSEPITVPNGPAEISRAIKNFPKPFRGSSPEEYSQHVDNLKQNERAIKKAIKNTPRGERKKLSNALKESSKIAYSEAAAWEKRAFKKKGERGQARDDFSKIAGAYPDDEQLLSFQRDYNLLRSNPQADLGELMKAEARLISRKSTIRENQQQEFEFARMAQIDEDAFMAPEPDLSGSGQLRNTRYA